MTETKIETTSVTTDDDGREMETARYRVTPDEIWKGDYLDFPRGGFVVAEVDTKQKYVTFRGQDEGQKIRLEIAGPEVTIVRKAETKLSQHRRRLTRLLGSDLDAAIDTSRVLALDGWKALQESAVKDYRLSSFALADALEQQMTWEVVWAPLEHMLEDVAKDDVEKRLAAVRALWDRLHEELRRYRVDRSTSATANLIEDYAREARSDTVERLSSLLADIVRIADDIDELTR